MTPHCDKNEGITQSEGWHPAQYNLLQKFIEKLNLCLIFQAILKETWMPAFAGMTDF